MFYLPPPISVEREREDETMPEVLEDATIAFAYDRAELVHAVGITSRSSGTGRRGELDEAGVDKCHGNAAFGEESGLEELCKRRSFCT